MNTVSDISIASNALLLLGHETISSFEDGTAGATIAANLYETTYLSLLTTHRWRFATKTVDLARLSVAPDSKYQYQYQIPSECLYVISTDTEDYEIYEGTIHANLSSLSADIIYRIEESKLPAYFSKMMEYNLAAQFAVPLTGDLEKGSYFTQIFNVELRKAKFADSSQRPASQFAESPYITARY